jgi:hypothetical protein
MAQYDLNKDGKLDLEELRRCPALLRSLESMDLNKDGCLDLKEIEERLKRFENGIALMMAPCRVVRENQPVEGVKVTLVPETFHGDSLKPASGTSDATGNVNLVIEGQSEVGVQAGFYRVQVSALDGSGKETLPARFNTDTVLGWEISSISLRRGVGIKIDLNQ